MAVGQTGSSAETLLRDAELAMQVVKSRGKKNIAKFETSMHQDLVDRLALDQALQEAVADKHLRVVYQPIIDLATGRLTGVEALCRWQHQEYGAVPPATFIARAGATGLIIALGGWVLTAATRQAALWQATYPHLPKLSMSVNLSAYQLSEPALVDSILTALAAAELVPSQLTLEITESAVMSGQGPVRQDVLRHLG